MDSADKGRILLISDDVGVISPAEKELTAAGFDVIVQDFGRPVVSSFQEHQPELVLIDSSHSAQDAFAVCQTLRGLPIATFFPIVILGAQLDELRVKRAIECGASDFIFKPINWKQEGYRLFLLLRSAARITSLDQIQRTLRENDKRQAAVLRSMPVAVYTARVPSQYDASWISDSVERFTGFSSERFVTEP